MRQTKKGNQWYFGTKAHIRVVTLHSIPGKCISEGRILHSIPGICAAFVLESRTEWIGGYLGYGQGLRVVLPKAEAKRRCRTEAHARLGRARLRRLSEVR
jgi:hypothetical protein